MCRTMCILCYHLYEEVCWVGVNREHIYIHIFLGMHTIAARNLKNLKLICFCGGQLGD